MTKLKYKSISPSGETHEGVIEAQDSYALARILKEKGETLIIAEEIKKKSLRDHLNISIGGRVKLAEKIAFAKNLAAMVDAGLTLSRGLNVMQRQTKNKLFQDALAALTEEVEKGTTLSQAMAKYPDIFSGLFISMVRAGEESGKLGESLRIVADQMDRTYSLQRKVRGAMMYPAIIISVMIIIGILMLMFVVPTLTATFKELAVDLPRSTQLVITVSDALKNHPIVALGSIIGSVLLVILFARTKQGKRSFEFLFLHTPVIGMLVKQTNAARMARTFSSLLSSGVEVVSAISITRDVMQNSYYKDVLSLAESEIQKGSLISSVFTQYEHLYPPMVGEMISVGEETGKLPDMLLQIASFYEGEVEQKTKDMSTIIEPFLMVIIGAGVGLFAISMISPIYSLSSGI